MCVLWKMAAGERDFRFLGTSRIIHIGGQFIKKHVSIANPLLFTLDRWNATCYFVLLCYCHVKAENNIIILGSRKQKRLKTETCRSDNVEEDKLNDTDECEPLVEPKAKAARRDFQSIWLEKYKCLRYNNTKGMLCLICIESLLLAALISELRHWLAT